MRGLSKVEIKIDKRSVTVDNVETRFNYPVKDILELANCCVVLLDIPKDQEFNENVYGVNMNGILWQIEPLEYIYDNSPYVSMLKEGGFVRLQNWDGTQLVVNPETGEVIERDWYR